jgi:hypothetical protein
MYKSMSSAILLSLLVATAATARNLNDVIQEAGAGWLEGTWESHDEAGHTTTTAYHWALDRHAVMLQLQSTRVNSRGMIFFRAADDEVVYVAADNRGGTSRGTCQMIDGCPVILYQYTSETGDKLQVAVLHRRVDHETFRGEVYEVNAQGQLSPSPLRTLVFQRKTSD